MTTVSQLKATLSEQLARVKAGEEIVVTEGGDRLRKLSLSGVKQLACLPICPSWQEMD
ncbi:MAG: hypothetical protein O7F12_07740 [Nitrospirae bacterium]|nr:hypothetical protein [Nitrospirota bacterium]